MRQTTLRPAEPADCSDAKMEFARSHQVFKLFGIPRGSLYNLLETGKIRGVSLRVTGNQKGLRLWDVQSIRDYIATEMIAQNPRPIPADDAKLVRGEWVCRQYEHSKLLNELTVAMAKYTAFADRQFAHEIKA